MVIIPQAVLNVAVAQGDWYHETIESGIRGTRWYLQSWFSQLTLPKATHPPSRPHTSPPTWWVWFRK
ncbi:hypothetical protein PAXRUDRAFT_827024 [Paxillus rubicundulus Ve08.2h10]|uniref:Uncharacterized protein n=1 Tax=Paxillus rubicundulus Ve08.2h10 TaxID=930991 RepID=A0A0D0DRB1_9AGAM|nr:hypothetical protein PAXRUDRAFT_827024 [Paxillus rubicundulus Ve08.2h10]